VTRVFDATPLIYLAKADRLGVVETLDELRFVPEAVYYEVVTEGIEAGYTDARRVEKTVEADRLAVVDVVTDDPRWRLDWNVYDGLSDADVAVLACADTRDVVAVMDEAVGRRPRSG